MSEKEYYPLELKSLVSLLYTSLQKGVKELSKSSPGSDTN